VLLQTHKGETVLHIAAKAGYVDMVQLLLEVGADVSAENKQKMTAQDLALMKGHQKIVQQLARHAQIVEVMKKCCRQNCINIYFNMECRILKSKLKYLLIFKI